MLTADLDHDEQKELLVAGNFFGASDLRGPYDAGFGNVLRYSGAGKFEVVSDAGFHVPGEARAMRTLPGTKTRIIVGRNNEAPLLFIRK